MREPGVFSFLRGLWRILADRPRVPRSQQDNALLREVLARRSVRRFADRPVPDDVLTAVLEAGRVAPSTVNLQTWSFVHFDADRWRDLFASPLPFGGRRAIVVLADVHRVGRVPLGFPDVPLCAYTVAVMNASLAAMNMTIAAEALGLGSVMLSETGRTGFYDARHLVQTLQAPPGVWPLMTLVLGYPATGRPPMPPRLPLDAVAFTGAYRETPQPVLDAWHEAMLAGYRASSGGRPFASQVDHYNRRLREAEADLRAMVLGGPDRPPQRSGQD